MRVGLQERRLHDLVGCRVITEPAVGERVNGALMAFDERLEALLAAGERAGDERHVLHAPRTTTRGD